MTPEHVVRSFITTFVSAWPRGDAQAVAACFGDDAVYINGPLEPVRGRAAVQEAIAGFMAMGGSVGVDMVNLLTGGTLVMTERVDRFVTEAGTFSLPMMGIFEVQDGLIVSWRDYFDLAQFTSQLAGKV